jgi:hypothetical protein
VKVVSIAVSEEEEQEQAVGGVEKTVVQAEVHRTIGNC